MNLDQAIHKATLLLDIKGDVVQAEAILRRAVAMPYEPGQFPNWIEAQIFLADLLCQTHRIPEAVQMLQNLLRLAPCADVELDLIAPAFHRANQLVSHYSNLIPKELNPTDQKTGPPTMKPQIRLRPAIPEDIAWIVAQEQRSEFEAFIGHWSAETHLNNLADPDKRYLMATDEAGQPGAYVILAGLTSPARSIELARIVVAQPGTGFGKPVLYQVIELAFSELNANRLWLDVFDDNIRARHTYQATGFCEEGTLREAVVKRDGSFGSLVIMSILAREYRAGLRS